ncbi:MAG: hypothetical protein ABW250_01480 [Pyrinomonadaceae bacterium]
MPTAAETVRAAPPEPAGRAKLRHFRLWLKDFNRDVAEKDEKFAQFRDWLGGLDDREVARSFYKHYHPTYLNLFSVFGDGLPEEEIHALASRCVRAKVWNESEYNYHLSRLLASANSRRAAEETWPGDGPFKLAGWDAPLVRSLLRLGRGLIVCSYRFGAVRFLASELALLGFNVNEVVNASVHRTMQSALGSLAPTPAAREGRASVENIRLLKAINAEDKECTVRFVDALKRGEVVGMCVEGNTGADGPWGDTSKSVVSFFNHQVSVKNGAARLALVLGTPMLPAVALRTPDGFGRVVFGDPFVAPRRPGRGEAERFIRDTMQSLYGLLESHALRVPEQWEGWSALHRWRAGADVPPSPERAARGLAADEAVALLRSGKSFRMNRRRVVPLPTGEGPVWIDVRTLKGYRNPKWAGAENILQALSESGGVDLDWVERRGAGPDWLAQVASLLAYLERSELIAAG